MSLELLRLQGREVHSYLSELADLRLKVFWDFPYLYEGSREYEKKYLETYLKAQHSFILLVKDQDRIVGATTSILAHEEEESFRKPFQEFGLNPREVFYFGESVLLSEYRGKGLGKVFFQEREAFARSLGFVSTLSFCSVVREEDHPMKPKDYRPLDEFWRMQGFAPEPQLITNYEWKDREEIKPSLKKMQYWLKKI